MTFLRLCLRRAAAFLRTDGWETSVPMVGALVLLIAVGAATGAFRAADNAAEEASFRLFSYDASGQVHVVEMDAATMAAVRRWPWPRDHYARVVRQLDAAGVRSISFDVDMSSSGDAVGDAAFAAAIRDARAPVTLPTFAQNAAFGDKRQLDSLPIPALREYARLGSVSVVLSLSRSTKNK